jgi:hypothetical protein
VIFADVAVHVAAMVAAGNPNDVLETAARPAFATTPQNKNPAPGGWRGVAVRQFLGAAYIKQRLRCGSV